MKFALLVLLALAACADGGEQPSNAHQQSIAELRAADEKLLASDPCLRREGDEWVHIGWRNCLELLPPRKMYGVWIDGFEESSFIPRATAKPRADDRVRFRVWLEVDAATVGRLPEASKGYLEGAHAYAITFIGRRSSHAGQYYTGDGDHVVVVDRLISVRYLGLMPEPDFVTAAKEGERLHLDQPLGEELWK